MKRTTVMLSVRAMQFFLRFAVLGDNLNSLMSTSETINKRKTQQTCTRKRGFNCIRMMAIGTICLRDLSKKGAGFAIAMRNTHSTQRPPDRM